MEQVENIKFRLRSVKDQLAGINEFNLNIPKEIDYMGTRIYENKQILTCKFEDILFALQNSIACGVTLNPLLDMGYILTPVRGVCVFYPGYQSFISRIVQTGHVEDIWANVVHDNCDIDIKQGSHPELKHIPYYMKNQSPGKKIGLYAAARLTSGSVKFEYRDYDYLKDVTSYSKLFMKYKALMNNKYFIDDMEKKTMIKYLWKYLPKNDRAGEVAVLLNTDNQAFEFSF